MSSKALLLVLPVLMACGRPAAEVLRQNPSPVLNLELTLPPDSSQPALQQVYLAAFRERFGKGLATGTEASPAGIQLFVLIQERRSQNRSLDQGTRNLDRALAATSGSPARVLHSALSPRSNYEEAASRLGYEPSLVRGQIMVLKPGKGGFQETLRLDPMRIIYRMRPLGEEARSHGGIEAEEGQAVALETLDLIQKKLGWKPAS